MSVESKCDYTKLSYNDSSTAQPREDEALFCGVRMHLQIIVSISISHQRNVTQARHKVTVVQ